MLYRYVVITLLLIINHQQSIAAPNMNICTTIRPIYSLVSNITKGVSEPTLIIKSANDSPHDYSLRPSDIRNIASSDIIFMISKEFELFMNKAVSSLAKEQIKVIELAKDPQINLLSLRENNLFISSNHHNHHHSSTYDNHIWLSPINAKRIVDNICDVLSKADPANKDIYQANTIATLKKLDSLHLELTESLSVIADVPYLVFHDAYQYFESLYHLSSLGAITINPEISPTIKAIENINKIIKKNHVKCIFSEPQFSPLIVEEIAKGAEIHHEVIDAEWGNKNSAPTEIYFDLIKDLKQKLLTCLTK